MDYSEIVSISGMSGLFKVESRRPDGMIVTAFNEDKPKFVSARIHMFTPLENITIYTEDDSIELKEVFQRMKKQEATLSPADVKADNDALKAYFEKIVPDYDKEKVYVSDIKKVLKWYTELNSLNLITIEKEKKEKKEKKEEKEDKKEKAGKEKAKVEKKPKKKPETEAKKVKKVADKKEKTKPETTKGDK